MQSTELRANKKNKSDPKKTLTKLAIETGGDWVTLLPFALFHVCNTPYQLNLTPFKILYGRPPPVCPILKKKKTTASHVGAIPRGLDGLKQGALSCLDTALGNTCGSK